MTAFIGVRISWLIVARNALFARVGALRGGRRLLQVRGAGADAFGHHVEPLRQRGQLAHPGHAGAHVGLARGDACGRRVELRHRAQDGPPRHRREHRHAAQQQDRHRDGGRRQPAGPAGGLRRLLRRAGVDEGEHLPDRLHDLGLGVQVGPVVEHRVGPLALRRTPRLDQRERLAPRSAPARPSGTVRWSAARVPAR